MAHAEQEHIAAGVSPQRSTEYHADEGFARIGPLQLLTGLVQAASAVAAAAWAARRGPDPIELRPRVLHDG